jgi:transposase
MKEKEKQKMRHQVIALYNAGYNQSQISRELSVDRKTIRRYLQYNDEDFTKWLESKKRRVHKLKQYEDYIREQLEETPFFSASQIEDQLKEKGMQGVHSKTVFNEVMYIRKKYNLAKPKRDERWYQKVEELAYGKQGQVDFGEYWMKKESGRQKIYLMGVVLSRSRYKQIVFRQEPFTTKTAIKAHQISFLLLGGIPKELVYDQDKLLLKDENGGDLIQTQEFKRYVESESFTVYYCRKSDPQSKGKIENVIKYIKQNFLRGRKFTSIELLNEQAQGWLERTGNGKKHQTTFKIPLEEWEIEKQYLTPIKNQHVMQEENQIYHTVRKDHTVLYKRNFYSVPLGTYTKEKSTQLQIKELEGEIIFYSKDETTEIARHHLCKLEGKVIKNNNHKRSYDDSYEKIEQMILDHFSGQKEQIKELLRCIKNEKPRYYRDQLKILLKALQHIPVEYVMQAITKCMDTKTYASQTIKEIALHYQSCHTVQPHLHILQSPKTEPTVKANTQPSIRNIEIYHQFFK